MPDALETTVVEPVASPVAPPVTAPAPTAPPEVKTIDKATFDKTASELAALKKWQKERMTTDELAQAEAEAKQTELDNLKAEIKKQKLIANQNLAMGLTAEIKSLAGIEEADTEYSDFINSLSSHDDKATAKLASAFAKFIKKAYENGGQDTARGTVKGLAKGITVGASGGSSGVSEGKLMAEKLNRNNLGTTDIFTKINK